VVEGSSPGNANAEAGEQVVSEHVGSTSECVRRAELDEDTVHPVGSCSSCSLLQSFNAGALLALIGNGLEGSDPRLEEFQASRQQPRCEVPDGLGRAFAGFLGTGRTENGHSVTQRGLHVFNPSRVGMSAELSQPLCHSAPHCTRHLEGTRRRRDTARAAI
jgi:hypothetical protein